MGLYLSAWIIYYIYAQTDVEFNLPYNPSRVLKINYILIGQAIGAISYLPIIASYLYWRYWELGTGRFKKIVRCVRFVIVKKKIFFSLCVISN